MYTDGACLGNPGPGGYGVVLLYEDAQHRLHRRELSAGYRLTTNNRMELLAAIAGLSALKMPCTVHLYTDSGYLANAMGKKWALQWQNNHWIRKGKPIPNADLWEIMLHLCQTHEVHIEWIRGHGNNSENERCDQLARQAAQRSPLLIDEGYERMRMNNVANIL